MSTFPRQIKQEVQKLPAVTQDIVAQRVRSAQIPVVYEEACKALAACSTIDEGKFWADKAEALAAWAKIYKSRQAEIEAKRLKLHAFRRMGQIAEELRPTVLGGVDGRHGGTKGPRYLLIDKGLSQSSATYAIALTKTQKAEFEKLLSMDNPPSPYVAVKKYGVGLGNKSGKDHKSSETYRKFCMSGTAGNLMGFRGFCRCNSFEEARNLLKDEVIRTRELIVELQEWLDAFEQALPKE